MNKKTIKGTIKAKYADLVKEADRIAKDEVIHIRVAKTGKRR